MEHGKAVQEVRVGGWIGNGRSSGRQFAEERTLGLSLERLNIFLFIKSKLNREPKLYLLKYL